MGFGDHVRCRVVPQLTLIAAEMLKSEHLIVRIIARLMGTHFSYLDLLSYVAGISCIYVVDY